MIERMSFGTSQVRPVLVTRSGGTTSVVQLELGDPLTVGLGVDATSPAELDGAEAFVWTNYGQDDPSSFVAIKMGASTPTDGFQRAFTLTLAPAPLGTFIATAYVDGAGDRAWAPDYAAMDADQALHGLLNRLVFRVCDPTVAGLQIREVPIDKANVRADSTDISTIDDLLDPQDGWYDLETLAATGVNCVWFQVPYRTDPQAGRPAQDDAGSDYASTDWFSISPHLSDETRNIPPWDLDRQHTVANEAMKRLIAKAHDLGLKVLLEIAPNHLGHNFIFRDEFGDARASDVRRRDYARATIDSAQLAQVQNRLASPDVDPETKNWAEYMLPQMYATRKPDGIYNPLGANSVDDTYSPDWYGLWSDVKHINHGGHPKNPDANTPDMSWWIATSPQNFAVCAYIGRVMAWAVTELGADGFRIDHAFGMPFHFFEQTLPWVEMQARQANPSKPSLIWVPEDHNRKDYTQRVADVVQSLSYKDVLEAFAAGSVGRIWDAVSVLERNGELFATGDHDEDRGLQWFGGDLVAFGNAVMAMQLLGGPTLTLAGDEFGEGQKLLFKSRGGVPVLWQRMQHNLPEANSTLAHWIGRAAQVAQAWPTGGERARPHLSARGGGETILAWERPTADQSVIPLQVFDNLARDGWTTATFDLGDTAQDRVPYSSDVWFQVNDLVGFDPGRPLWNVPRSGKALHDDGIDLGLQPLQIQALQLVRVG